MASSGKLSKCQMVSDHEDRLAILENMQPREMLSRLDDVEAAVARQQTAAKGGSGQPPAADHEARIARMEGVASGLWVSSAGLECRRASGGAASSAALPGGMRDFAVCQPPAEWSAYEASLTSTFGQGMWRADKMAVPDVCTPILPRMGEAGQLFSARAVVCAEGPAEALAQAGELRSIRDRVCA